MASSSDSGVTFRSSRARGVIKVDNPFAEVEIDNFNHVADGIERNDQSKRKYERGAQKLNGGTRTHRNDAVQRLGFGL